MHFYEFARSRAELDMFRTRKSWRHTIAWFWLIVVVGLVQEVAAPAGTIGG
jgi:hypothetical protein